MIDESGFAKKGKHSVGVARQWNGGQGRVGVFSTVGKGHMATVANLQLYLPPDEGGQPSTLP